MLSKEIYTREYIWNLYERTGSDPALLEKVIYAFGLLEAIRKVGLPFCFKGGTSLLLLLEHPMRLSTDIDIIVEPGTKKTHSRPVSALHHGASSIKKSTRIIWMGF